MIQYVGLPVPGFVGAACCVIGFYGLKAVVPAPGGGGGGGEGAGEKSDKKKD
jgi:hypothetical protein